MSGNVYINNVDFAFPKEEFKPGFIALLTPDGALRKVAENIAFPNGMANTPDNKTLICAESFTKKLLAFDIDNDRSLSNKRVWAELKDIGADGISLDAEGAVWCASGNACIRVREGGEILNKIELDRFCFSCVLGGDDGKTLFMCAADWTGKIPTKTSDPTGRIYSIKVDVPAFVHNK